MALARYTALLLLVTVTLTACNRREQAPAQPQARPVDVAQIQTTELPVTFEFIGRTASSQRVEIRARVAGFLEDIAYEEGKFVDEGDTLFRIDPKPFQARLRASKAELAQLQARLENAQALLRRVEPLAEAQAVAQKELDDAQGSVREAAAAVEAASARVFEAELNLGYTNITSPVHGLTSSATQREGAYLGVGTQPLTYVARIDPIWVEFSVSEAQMLRRKKAREEGSFKVPEDDAYSVSLVLADNSLHPHTGRISFADASINEQTGTFLVRAEIPNPGGEEALRPGQYVRVHIEGASRTNAVLVPKKAVLQNAKGPYVWLVNPQGQAEIRPVVTGNWVDDLWVIRSGLQNGDRVVVDGIVGLTPETPLSITNLVPIQTPKTGAIE